MRTLVRKFKNSQVIIGLLVLLTANLSYGNSGITYHGKILRPDGVTPVTSTTTQFRIQVRTPGGENCLLWEEQQTKDLSSTNGVFTLTINDTSEPSLIANTLPFGLERVFSNRSNFTGLTGCSTGNSYNPTLADGRNLQVYFREQPTDPWEQMPLTKVNYVPMALNSIQLEGYQANEFLKIDPLSSYTPLTAANVTTLMDIISGTSNLYIKNAQAFGGDVSGTYNAISVDKVKGVAVAATAPTTGQVLKYNGTTWAPAADDNNASPGDSSYTVKGVVQINTDLATSGLFIAGGVLALPNVITAGGPTGTAQTVPVITYDQKGRLTAVSTATIDDNTKLPLAGGTMTGNINMGTHDITNAANVAATNIATRNVVLSDSDTNTITIRAPADVTPANYNLVLPATPGTNGYVLSTDGSGNLNWINPSGGSVTNVSSANSYLTVTTPNSTPVLTVNVGTAANTVAAGDDARIVGALQTTTYDADVLPAASCTNVQTAYWNSIAGTWACQNIGAVPNATTAVNFTGSLAGDVSGTQGATSVDKLKGKNISAATLANQIMIYDGTNWVNNVVSGDATLASTGALALKNTGTAGTYYKVTTDAQGRVTSGADLVAGDITTALGYTPVNKAGDTMGGTLGLYATAADPSTAGWNATQKGYTWFNTTSNQVKYWDGSSVQALGVSGAGLTSLGGQGGSTQTFASGAAGTAPAISSAANVHTLNVPLASGAGVTSGTISKTDYDNFAAKLTSPLTTKGDLHTYTTTDARLGVGTDGQVLTADSAQASGLKWNTLSINSLLPSQATNSGKFLTTDGTNVSWSPVTSGTVTSVSSTNAYLSVATGTTTPALTVNVGTAANTVAAGDDARIVGALQTTTYDADVLPAASCTNVQTAYWNSIAGTWACQNINFASTGGFVDGGNTMTATATLGTNSNHNLEIETNGTTKMTILAGGNVGIGTTTPTLPLEVNGKIKALGAELQGQAGINGGNADFSVRTSNGNGYWDFAASQTQSGNFIMFDALNSKTPLVVEPNTPDNSFYIRNTGAIGIGTNLPNTALDINGAVSHRGMAAPALSVAGQGRMYFDSTSNTYKISQNGGAYADILTSANAPGDITDVVAGAGLTGGATSGSATLDIGAGTGIVVNANDVAVDVGTAAGKIVQVQAGGKLPALDGSDLTNLDAGDIATGTLPIARGGTGQTTAVAALNALLPTQAANAGKVLQTDGTNATWTTPAATGVTSVTSANSYLSIANTTTTPVITANVGTAANTLAAGDDARIVGALQTSVYDADVLPAASCTTSQTPYWNSIAGTWACQTISVSGLGGFVDGGNTMTATATLGTNSNHNLEIETNGTTKMIVQADGKVGIGTTSPSDTLDVRGTFTAGGVTTGVNSISGLNGVALGSGLNVGGNNAIGMGYNGTASGSNALVANYLGQAAGNNSAVFGEWNSASSRGEFAVGIYGLSLGGNATTIVSTDPVFTIGNGTGSGARSNAMTVLKNGNTGIGVSAPTSLLDINGAITHRGIAAPAVSAAGQGRIYFDSTSNKYRVSQNNGAYVDLIPAGGAVGGSGTINALPRFTAGSTLGDSAIVDNGTTITATRSIATVTNPIAAGAALNLATSNTHTLAAVGGSVITISNQSNGGVYNIAVEDTTSRTYTFSGCTNSYFKPANGPTQAGTRTVYGLMTIQKGANWDCYITWSSGFQ